MPIQVVLFDLGSTLIYSKNPWRPIYRRADQALAKVLKRFGIRLGPDRFYTDHDSFMEAYYSRRNGDYTERTACSALRDLLAEKGFPDVPDPVLRTALDASYAVTQANWYVEDDAIRTLSTLTGLGYRLGMISNTSDDKNVQQLVDRFGLRTFFEIILTSAAFGIRKPDRRIFQAALDHFEAPPGCAAMVGDTPSADLEGANRMGIFSIWIARRAPGADPAIQPRAVVGALSEIPAVLSQLI
jgi:HAD superfamily hydrolase (TIGR01662 family)